MKSNSALSVRKKSIKMPLSANIVASRSRSAWMMMYDCLVIDFLKSMIGKNRAKDEQIIKVIHKFKNKLEKKNECMD